MRRAPHDRVRARRLRHLGGAQSAAEGSALGAAAGTQRGATAGHAGARDAGGACRSNVTRPHGWFRVPNAKEKASGNELRMFAMFGVGLEKANPWKP